MEYLWSQNSHTSTRVYASELWFEPTAVFEPQLLNSTDLGDGERGCEVDSSVETEAPRLVRVVSGQ